MQGFQAFDASEKGAWEVLPGGDAALRLTIRSAGAESHVLVFRFANVPSRAACAVADSHRGLRAYAGHPSGSRIVFELRGLTVYGSGELRLGRAAA